MLICSDVAGVRAAMKGLRRERGVDAIVGMVPTMGAIHAGHLSLVKAAREASEVVVASIFVNPLQFAAGEDLEKYPRVFEADRALLADAGVDVLFAPTAEEMYGEGASTVVEVQGISDRLDGASRPGHFRGVATVVTKLFNIVGPDVAFFGQKDAAQIAVLRAMVRDLNMPVRLVTCPTVREQDGLAMSSRNRYLGDGERQEALAISRALRAAEGLVRQGETGREALRGAMLAALDGLRVDYVEVVNPATLEQVEHVEGEALLAVAAWVGTTRLIDNCVVTAVTHG